ncbi:MAG: hypothetical protein K9L62_02115 [Vallitaleaceae bacterium]|nr:hypothetical protein [Vallitaleaceae bacterium]
MEKVFRNAEKYYDPTCGDAINNIDREMSQEKFNKIIKTIIYICELAGFKIHDQIVLRCKSSGRLYYYKK